MKYRIIRSGFLIIAPIAVCLLLFFVEQKSGISYVWKSLLKIILFLGLPISFYLTYKTEREKHPLKPGELKRGLVLGGIAFLAILLAAYLFRSGIRFDQIALELQNKLKITPTMFIFVGLYIIAINSFLEEAFFRGYIFINLEQKGYRTLGYIFSSLLFALYHLAIFITWFNPIVVFIALAGLFTVGLLFCWVNSKSNHFYNSWIIHISADIAIILIGLRMFGLI